MIKLCVVIPVYNHEHAIGQVVAAVLRYNLPCILVDDGSSPRCAKVLDELARQYVDCVTLVRHQQNGGKGKAVLTGMHYAQAAGYTHALQIDADGQHNTDDIPRFVELAKLYPEAVIAGCPQYDDSVPKVRLYSRYLTHVWVWINTLSLAIKDSMCGFRVYPLQPLLVLAAKQNLGDRMDFDVHVLVRLYWEGLEIVNVPTQVKYPLDGISHFRALYDNLLISRMHTQLFFGMLLRIPKLLTRKIKKKHWAHIDEVSFVAGMTLLFWVFRYFGRWPFRILLYPVVFSYVVTQSAARAASKKYLQHINAIDKNSKVKPNIIGVLQHFSAFSEAILDKMRIWSSGVVNFEAIHYFGQEYIKERIAKNQGGLFICAHFGNLDLCRALAKECAGLKLTVLVHTKHAQKFERMLAKLDPGVIMNLMQVTEISAATAITLAEKISQGEFVVIAGDRIPVSSNPRVAFASFLGEKAPFPIGPYVLANLLQCPVFLLFSMRTAAGIELHFEPFRELIQLSRQDRDKTFNELIRDYAARLEFFCLREPLQWFNFYDFWHMPKNINDKR